MAMGKKPAARQGSPLWVTTADLPTNAGHPFFERLNRVLDDAGFDAFVEGLCAVFYASRMGRPSLRPGPHASPYFGRHQITPKTSRYTRCSMSMLPNVSINGRMRSSGQLGRWWYSISPCRNNECVRRFTVFAFSQRS